MISTSIQSLICGYCGEPLLTLCENQSGNHVDCMNRFNSTTPENRLCYRCKQPFKSSELVALCAGLRFEDEGWACQTCFEKEPTTLQFVISKEEKDLFYKFNLKEGISMRSILQSYLASRL